jgi:ureidoglycolate hydrolase
MKLAIQELTQERFEPYGTVIEQPSRPTDATGPGWQWWGEMVQMRGGDRPYAVGYLDLKPAEFRFDWAERHMHSDELLAPLGADCLVYVAPPDFPAQPDRLPALEQFEVFRVRQGQAVLLKPGVWHGAPMAEDRPLNVLVLLLQNSGKQDVYVRHFEDTPVEIQKP